MFALEIINGKMNMIDDYSSPRDCSRFPWWIDNDEIVRFDPSSDAPGIEIHWLIIDLQAWKALIRERFSSSHE